MSQVVQLPVEVMNRVLSVLTALPYNQVADVITEVQSNVKVVSVESAEEKEAEEA
jgi:hypothetical protein